MEAEAIGELAGKSGEGVKAPRSHGYGVRFDPGVQRYRVRNEVTGEWLCEDSGELASFTFFGDAYTAWRVFEVHPRPGER